MRIYWLTHLENDFEFEVSSPEVARGCLNAIAAFDIALWEYSPNTGGCEFLNPDMNWDEWRDSEKLGIFDSDLIVPEDNLAKECLISYQGYLIESGLRGRDRGSNVEQTKELITMHNDLTLQEQELRLQEKYPVGTRGRIRFDDSLADFYSRLGWTPESIAVVESAYVSGVGYECLTAIIENGLVKPLMCKAEEFEVLSQDHNE